MTPLRGCEIDAEHRFRHVNSDPQSFQRLPHGLLRSDRDFKTTTGARLQEADVLLHVHRNGYKTGKGATHRGGLSQRQAAGGSRCRKNKIKLKT